MAYALLLSPLILVLFGLSRVLWNHYRYIIGRNANACSDAPRYQHTDPILGLDLIRNEKKAHDASVGLRFKRDLFRRYGKTVDTRFFGTRVVRTMDKLNAQAVLALKAQDFGLQPLREGIAEPFFGRGINTTDGKHWEFSQSLVKPTFSRAEISSFAYLERHLERFFDLLPSDAAETVDLQPLFARFFLDTSTEFLFGKSADTLLPSPSSEDKQFIDSYHYVMRGFGVRVRLAWMKFLHRDPKWFEAVRTVHRWVEKYIDAAMAQQQLISSSEKTEEQITAAKSGRQYYLLQEMVKSIPNKDEVRSEILAVFMPSQDTQSWLLSNIFHLLARNQRVWRKLRTEILELGDKPLTFESLKSLRYLQSVINEALRIHPISESAPRVCLKDSTLPTGGGPNRDQPIFVRKGDMITVHMSCMFQDEDIWGEDAAQFHPERWAEARPLWGFIPFGGGVRTCPAQQLVYTETAYVVVRMMQRFEKIENRDPHPWTEQWLIAPMSKYGCQVALSPA